MWKGKDKSRMYEKGIVTDILKSREQIFLFVVDMKIMKEN